jgi:hypothetical protein
MTADAATTIIALMVKYALAMLMQIPNLFIRKSGG